MTDRILAALKKLDIKEYLIVEEQSRSAQMFFIKKTLDMKRVTDYTAYTVTVFVDFEKDSKQCKGHSKVYIFPGMTDGEIEAILSDAVFAAGFAANPTYEIPGPSDNTFLDTDSDMAANSMEENCRIVTEALFAEDTRTDVFINSAELFLYDTAYKIINSKGIDAGYRRLKIWGEFVAQCRQPQDVETYKNFSYKNLDTGALRDKVRKTLEYTKARAEAHTAPETGNYRLILSDEYIATLFDFYLSKADASYVYAGYSDYSIGKDVQVSEEKPEVTGDRLNVLLKASKPYSSEGIRMKDRVLLKEGRLETITGTARFAHYLGTEPTGDYEDIKVEAGTTSVEEMKKKPYLWVVNFSDFQMDDFTGHFGGEIRLAFLYDGDKVTPVTGGSVNGSWFDVQGRLVLSSETQIEKGFEGPLAICMEDIPVAGV